MTNSVQRRSVSSRLFALLLAVSALAGFNALNNVAAQAPVEVSYGMMAGAAELEGWRAQVEVANRLLAEQNITITVQEIPSAGWGEYYQRIVAQIAARRAPDIGRIAESFMPQVISSGHAVDLTEYMQGLDMSQYFESAFYASAHQGDSFYGFPSGTYNMLLYYNKDIFDEAGLPYPSSDWGNAITFEQVQEYARTLTQGEGANKRFGFAAGPFMGFIGMYAKSNGGENVFHEDGSCALTDPEALEVYEWFDTMMTEGVQPRPTDTAVVSTFEMFRAGRLAMLVDGTWFLNPMREIDNFSVGIAAVPSGTGQAYSSQFVDAWVVWRGTRNEAAAWEALKALNSKEALDALAAAGVGGTPVHRGTLEEADILGDRFDEADRAAFSGALEHGLSVPYNEHYQEIDDRVNATMGEWLLGRIDYQGFAERVCGIVEEVAGQ